DSSSLREPQLHAALEKCLLDLRLLTDSMDGDEASLGDRLAQLRYRVGPVLAQRGIRVTWDLETAQNVGLPRADSAVHLMASVQEALSNALQHALATEIEVRASTLKDQAAWRIEMRDNGRGMAATRPGGTTGGGSGMAGMAR